MLDNIRLRENIELCIKAMNVQLVVNQKLEEYIDKVDGRLQLLEKRLDEYEKRK